MQVSKNSPDLHKAEDVLVNHGFPFLTGVFYNIQTVSLPEEITTTKGRYFF
jgi:hypothetical protein